MGFLLLVACLRAHMQAIEENNHVNSLWKDPRNFSFLVFGKKPLNEKNGKMGGKLP